MTTTIHQIEDAIHNTNRAFEAAFDRGDAAGLAAVYTVDGQVLPPNGDIVAGRSALQNFWQAVMDMGIKSVTLKTKELEYGHDIVYEVGEAVLYGEGKQALDTVKYVIIWKEEDGGWKWHRDIWNSNNPPA